MHYSLPSVVSWHKTPALRQTESFGTVNSIRQQDALDQQPHMLEGEHADSTAHNRELIITVSRNQSQSSPGGQLQVAVQERQLEKGDHLNYNQKGSSQTEEDGGAPSSRQGERMKAIESEPLNQTQSPSQTPTISQNLSSRDKTNTSEKITRPTSGSSQRPKISKPKSKLPQPKSTLLQQHVELPGQVNVTPPAVSGQQVTAPLPILTPSVANSGQQATPEQPSKTPQFASLRSQGYPAPVPSQMPPPVLFPESQGTFASPGRQVQPLASQYGKLSH